MEDVNKYYQGCEIYSEMIEEHPTPSAIVLSNGIILYANKSLTDFLGYEKHTLEGSHFRLITHSDDYDIDADLFKKLNNGDIHKYEIKKRYLKKDGSIVNVILTVKRKWLKGHQVNVIYGFFLPDIIEFANYKIKLIETNV